MKQLKTKKPVEVKKEMEPIQVIKRPPDAELPPQPKPKKE